MLLFLSFVCWIDPKRFVPSADPLDKARVHNNSGVTEKKYIGKIFFKNDKRIVRSSPQNGLLLDFFLQTNLMLL